MEKKHIISMKEIETKKMGDYNGRCLTINGVDFPVYEVKIIDGLIDTCYISTDSNKSGLNQYITLSLKLPLDFYKIDI